MRREQKKQASRKHVNRVLCSSLCETTHTSIYIYKTTIFLFNSRVQTEYGYMYGCSSSTCACVLCCAAAWQEAVCTGDEAIARLLLEARSAEMARLHAALPRMLARLRDTPDFYVEMRWEFDSWVPFVKRLAPNDVCRIWKSGAAVRIDASFLGIDRGRPVRGNVSYVFAFAPSSQRAVFYQVDHERREVTRELFDFSPVGSRAASPPRDLHASASASAPAQPGEPNGSAGSGPPAPAAAAAPPSPASQPPTANSTLPADYIEFKLRNPVVTNFLDTESIVFSK